MGVQRSDGPRTAKSIETAKVTFAVLLIGLVIWLWGYQEATHLAAQSGTVVWSEPVRLSDPEVDAWPPAIVTDMAGTVHVMWSQTMSEEDPTLYAGDTLFYTRWNGREWSPLADVLVSSTGTQTSTVGAPSTGNHVGGTFVLTGSATVTGMTIKENGSIHAQNNLDNIKRVGEVLSVSRLVVNAPSATTAGGSFFNGFSPSTTLGCGSWGNNSISENFTYKHLLNISRIGLLREDVIVLEDEEIWALNTSA